MELNSMSEPVEQAIVPREENETAGAASFPAKSCRGRRAEYHSPQLLELIFQCWRDRECMCAKRLVIQLQSWLDEYEALNQSINEELKTKFLSISAATIDRILKPRRDQWYRR